MRPTHLSYLCKRLRTDEPTPCWWPQCDCDWGRPAPRRSRLYSIWDGFIYGLASPGLLITRLLKRFR